MVKVIPREDIKERESGMLILVFWFSFFIFCLVAGLFFLFDYQARNATIALAEIESEISGIGTQEQLRLKATLYNYKKKIDDIAVLLSQHGTPTKIFDLLEDNIHPGVWFYSFDFTNEQNKINLKGNAQDMVSLAQQILIIEEVPQIEKIHLTSARLTENGNIEFRLDISLSSSALLIK